MKDKLLFKEEQSFVGTWSWYLVLIVCCFMIAGIALNVIQYKTTDSIIGLIIGGITTGGVLLLFAFLKLEITIDRQNIYYRYAPFISSERKLTKDHIREIRVRKYQPILEYGGWGYRTGWGNGKALNVAGNIGLQLILKDGKKILLGTQKGEAMKKAVEALKENWEVDA